jgi:hypothetical protein
VYLAIVASIIVVFFATRFVVRYRPPCRADLFPVVFSTVQSDMKAVEQARLEASSKRYVAFIVLEYEEWCLESNTTK